MPLIAMAGLPGTGKSTLAQAIIKILASNIDMEAQPDAQNLPVILNKDTIRAALFPPALIEYSREQDDFCAGMMLRVAGYLFHKNPNRTIILDGRTFSHRDHVRNVERAAEAMGVRLYWIECVCDSELAKQRLLTGKGLHPAANRGPDLYDRVRGEADPLTVPRLTVDTTQALEVCVADVLRYLSSIASG